MAQDEIQELIIYVLKMCFSLLEKNEIHGHKNAQIYSKSPFLNAHIC